MSPLIPEKRTDKNGRLVTRHVRSGTAPSSTASIPKPVLAGEKTGKTKAPSTVQKTHEGVTARWADARLKELAEKNGRADSFTCSDAEAYDVLSVTNSPENTIQLLRIGVRTNQQAVSFLRNTTLSDLQDDGTAVVEELVRRGIPGVPAMAAMIKFSFYPRGSKNFYDAVETESVRAFSNMKSKSGDLPYLVYEDSISLADLRAIGATRVQKYPDIYTLVEELKKQKKGVSPHSIEQLRDLVALGIEHSTTQFNDPIKAANAYGFELVTGLNNYAKTMAGESGLRNRGYTAVQRGEMLQLRDALGSANRNLPLKSLWEAYDAGLRADEIIDGLDGGLEMRSIIAIKSGIEKSVSSGWL